MSVFFRHRLALLVCEPRPEVGGGETELWRCVKAVRQGVVGGVEEGKDLSSLSLPPSHPHSFGCERRARPACSVWSPGMFDGAHGSLLHSLAPPPALFAVGSEQAHIEGMRKNAIRVKYAPVSISGGLRSFLITGIREDM